MRALVMGVSKESWTTLRGLFLVALLQKVAHDLTQRAEKEITELKGHLATSQADFSREHQKLLQEVKTTPCLRRRALRVSVGESIP
ncbi:hypothetical protein Pint_15963 [Pistacia integerrima]|uniref:Uncharacterized protein n=1 Tax=Pistacia integerrima TaxID=434235 RepID=A0ACC0ZAW4_9ROSI|nr:hypothetical protein Pint_15963 [Pistacia integerrima]